MAITFLGTGKIQFGSERIVASNVEGNRCVPHVFLSTSLTVSTKTMTWGGFPLSLYWDEKGSYAPAVVVETGNVVANGPQDCMPLVQSKIALAKSGNQLLLAVRPLTAGGSAVAGTTRFRGMPLAKNAAGSLIMVAVSPTVDDLQIAYLGGVRTKVARAGNKWYLVVSDTTT